MKLSIKKILPRTLFGRSLLILVIPVLLIQVITTFVFFDRHWEKMTDRLAFAVAGEISIIAAEIEKDIDEAEIEEVAAYAARSLDMLISYKPDGRLETIETEGQAKGTKQSIVAKTLAKSMTAQVRRPFLIHVDIKEKWVTVNVQLSDGLLHVSLPQRRLFSSSGYIFLLWMIGISLALLAIAILFMRNQIRPIRRLAIAAERFGRGMEIPASFKPEGAREVRQAAKAFLEMHDRIRRQIQQRTAMLAGVSHDLRTPLTRMKLQASMMGNNPDIESLKTDIDDMERMINAYLDFARGEGGEQTARTNLKEMLERIAAKARRQNTNVDLTIDGDLLLQLRPIAFERCLNNIVSNARKYGDHIWISAIRGDDAIEISIDDNGPGVPEEQYEEMFKPFVRGEPSRNPGTGGVGLGLPIAQDIVHSHGGRIWLEKSTHGGLRVMIQLPV